MAPVGPELEGRICVEDHQMMRSSAAYAVGVVQEVVGLLKAGGDSKLKIRT